ncbi:nitrilase-related carbon-nitrogen hydrolase [Streptomyces sp. NBC_01304]|uniref:nitrilase-related carbon-nitrogen hydrolase n=1 Tax=Streptomyces sp. NBC_01304 TaxID=2903818 RepID=UPI002E0E79C5|nr:hydrolase [Streptomyces sp. NBC_01304]
MTYNQNQNQNQNQNSVTYDLLTSFGSPLGSPARLEPPQRPFLRTGLVQMRRQSDEHAHDDALRAGIRLAASRGATVVCLPELTRSPYFAADEAMAADAVRHLEDIPDGPTTRLITELATELGITVHASLYERAADGGLGYNTAVCVGPDGTLLARTRKNHIPAFPGYREDLCFRPGDSGFPVVEIAGAARFGFPTCWDEWFPELARTYALRGAEILVHPTAIGSEPDMPEFDTRPMWEQAISSNGLANALFMVVPNRVGTEGRTEFYGSSFISDPYGRVMLRAPRDRPAVLVADLDLDQRRDWLDFGLLQTRRPELYGQLIEPVTT